MCSATSVHSGCCGKARVCTSYYTPDHRHVPHSNSAGWQVWLCGSSVVRCSYSTSCWLCGLSRSWGLGGGCGRQRVLARAAAGGLGGWRGRNDTAV